MRLVYSIQTHWVIQVASAVTPNRILAQNYKKIEHEYISQNLESLRSSKKSLLCFPSSSKAQAFVSLTKLIKEYGPSIIGSVTAGGSAAMMLVGINEEGK